MTSLISDQNCTTRSAITTSFWNQTQCKTLKFNCVYLIKCIFLKPVTVTICSECMHITQRTIFCKNPPLLLENLNFLLILVEFEWLLIMWIHRPGWLLSRAWFQLLRQQTIWNHTRIRVICAEITMLGANQIVQFTSNFKMN